MLPGQMFPESQISQTMKVFNSRLVACPVCFADASTSCWNAEGKPQGYSHLERARISRWTAMGIPES
jgi:hypothetical protein